MKILLVGGHSLLAQALHPVLSQFSEVLTAGRSECDLELDLSWPAARFSLPAELDVVINLAAHFGGTDFGSMLTAEEVNTLGTLKLAHACSKAGVKHLIQVSSIFAGLSIYSPFFDCYALSKRHAEEVVTLYCHRTSLPLTILRPAQIYGEGEGFRGHHPFLYSLMDRAQRGEDIVLYGRNDALRNFIHIDDVAEVLACLVRQKIEGCYVCASLSNISYSEIAATAIAVFDSSSKIYFDHSLPDVPDNAFAADTALYQQIGYFPRISLAKGLAREAARRKAIQ